MSVIVDTTIWSKYFRRKFHEKNTEIIDEMSKLIETQKVVIIGPIRQELLSGISNKNVFTKLKAKMRAFINYKVKTADYELAVEYYNSCMKNGIQGSVTDLLICAVSVRNKFEIFTEDGDFPKYKKYLPIKIYRKLA